GDAFNTHDLGQLDGSFADDYVYHAMGRDIPGIDGYKATLAPVFDAFPDITNTIDAIVAEGDLVAIRWTGRGPHSGHFMGVAPTGRPIELSGITVERIVDGKRIEGWAVPNLLPLLQQIGAIPAPGGPPGGGH